MPTQAAKPTILTYRHGLGDLAMFPGTGCFLIFVALWFWGLWEEVTWWMGVMGGIGVLLLCIRKGLQIDVSKRRYREYYSLFGFKEGKWSSLDRFCDLLMLQPLPEKIHDSLDMYIGKTNTDGLYEIRLANHNHLYRLDVEYFNDHDKAMEEMKKLADATGFPYVRYNPQNKRRREVHYSPQNKLPSSP